MKFLNKAHYGAYILAIFFGLTGKLISKYFSLDDIEIYFPIFLFIFYFIYCFFIEKHALKSRGKTSGEVSFKKIYLLREVLLARILIIFALVWFTYSKVELTSTIKFITIPFVTYFIVGGIFEIYRLLRI